MKYKLYTLGLFLIWIICQVSFAATSEADKICCLKNAYKPYISKVTKDNRTQKIFFYMKSGQKILWQDKYNKTFEEKLASSSLADMLSQSYPAYQSIDKTPRFNHDPGRFRNTALFQAVYGNTQAAVEKHLVKVQWLPNTAKRLRLKPIYLLFNSRNGAAAALTRVSNALDRLPSSFKKYVLCPAGTFKWRRIAGTKRYSAHSYGIAIDINTAYSNYWRWDHKNHLSDLYFKYHNRIPAKIVSIFERNHFIWGGCWYHYDTMHFEYRPEFFNGC